MSVNNKTGTCLCDVINCALIQQDLHERIDRTRYTDPLEDSGFQYGFNSTYLKKVVSYWRHEFDWKKQVAVLNMYPHFKTKIEGTHSPAKSTGFALIISIFGQESVHTQFSFVFI